MGFDGIMSNAKSVLSSCGSHSASLLDKFGIYGKNVIEILIFTVVVAGLALLISFIGSKFLIKKNVPSENVRNLIPDTMISFFVISLILQFVFWLLTLQKYSLNYDYFYFAPLIVFSIVCSILPGVKDADNKAKDFFYPLIINVLVFVAVILLTNLPLFSSLSYLSGGVVCSLACVYLYITSKYGEKYRKSFKTVIILFCFVTVFIKGWNYLDDEGIMRNVTCVSNIVKKGPAKGIITEYMKSYINNTTFDEMEEYIACDSILLIGGKDSLFYIDREYEVGSYTTISTPYYDYDSIHTYFENNPDKYPDVVMIPCWYGQLQIPTDDYLYVWTTEEYEYSNVYEGSYYRFFVR